MNLYFKKNSEGIRYITVVLLVMFNISFCIAQKNEICITFDDLPFVTYGMDDTLFLRTATDNLVSALKRNNIPAIGFVVGRKLFRYDKPDLFQINLLNLWLKNGLELGNHTFSHPDYNNVDFSEYSGDILKCDAPMREIMRSKGLNLKYFRHPFLHIGDTKSKVDSLINFLKKKGYIPAPVTIDNDDYLFAVAYKRMKDKKDTIAAKQIGKDYVDYMEKKLKYYEKQSKILFKRNIKQIILMHANYLNSDYIDSLIIMFKKNNYKFINLAETLEDPVYQTEIKVFGKYGISWIDRWALSFGKKSDFFREDPLTPDYIIELSKNK